MCNRFSLFLFCLVAILFSSCEEILEKPLTDTQVVLLSPANNGVFKDSIQLFYWEKLEDSAQYQLQVVSPSFDSIVRLQVDTIVDYNKISLLLNKGKYQWRVRAVNSNTTGKFSNTWSLVIK